MSEPRTSPPLSSVPSKARNSKAASEDTLQPIDADKTEVAIASASRPTTYCSFDAGEDFSRGWNTGLKV